MPAPKDPIQAKLWQHKISINTKIAMANLPKSSIERMNDGRKKIWSDPIIRKNTIAAMSKSHMGERNSNYGGKSCSEEWRKNQIKSHTGHKDSNITRQKKSDSRKGEKNPAWKGGIANFPYCLKFNKRFKERVRAFFSYTCQVCGHVWQPGEKKLAVHHVNYKKDSCCNPETKRYFVPVCPNIQKRGCHGKTGFNREHWEKHFMEIIEKQHDGRCYFTEEEMEQLKGAI